MTTEYYGYLSKKCSLDFFFQTVETCLLFASEHGGDQKSVKAVTYHVSLRSRSPHRALQGLEDRQRGTRNESHEEMYVQWGVGAGAARWAGWQGMGLAWRPALFFPQVLNRRPLCVQTEAEGLISPSWRTNTQTTAGLQNTTAVFFCSGRTFEALIDQESESMILKLETCSSKTQRHSPCHQTPHESLLVLEVLGHPKRLLFPTE